MNQKEKSIVKKCWKEIKKQAIKGSGIHLAVQIFPSCKIHLVAGIDKFGRRFEAARDINNPKEDVKKITQQALETKKLTKKELKRLKLI